MSHLSAFARSCRPCTEVDMHSILWQSRHRVSGTKGGLSCIHSGSSTYDTMAIPTVTVLQGPA